MDTVSEENQEVLAEVKQDVKVEMEARAKKMKVSFVDLSQIKIDKETAAIIPREMADRHKLICIGKLEKKITLAMVDPQDIFALDEVRFRTGFQAESVLASQEDIVKAISAVYGEDKSWVGKLEQFGEGKAELIKDADETKDEEVVIDQPVIIAVNKIITEAVDKKASDIHVEPFENDLLVRYRIDGILHEIMDLPKSIQPALVSRIKIMSNLNIAEKRIPQDGRIHVKIKDRDLDVRVSTLPALQGETVVMRLLDRKRMMVDLNTLGFMGNDLEKFKGLIDHPHGIILVTGPTGSGKSTTLYATLNALNQPHRKIVTIEDPVEYYLRGIIQVQTNARVGLTFAAGLRSFLRQDPDVMMVGEIRDKETATIAIESALTGHLVLSTLHTNDAVGSVTRLVDMGVEPFLISSTMIGALAQRLVRVICPACKEEIKLLPELFEVFKNYDYKEEDIHLMKGKRCPECNNTGYKGRIGIYELLVVTEESRELIIKRVSSNVLLEQAKKEGLETLFEDGLRKVAAGITTYEEICRVTAE